MRFQARFWASVAITGAICLLTNPSAMACHTNVWDSANDLIDTTDYSGLGASTGYWFANFGNAAPVVGAPMNSNEASNIPGWIGLDTNPANAGSTFSFQDGPPISTSTGGQPNFNTLTLPDGTVGLSGESVDDSNTPNNTDNYVTMVMRGPVPDARFWVVVDNGGTSQANANPNARLRFRIRHADDMGDIQVEALPGGVQIGNVNNGIADAYAFAATGLVSGDIIKIRVSSAANSHGGIAGIMFQGTPVPEPCSVVLLAICAGLVGIVGWRRRR